MGVGDIADAIKLGNRIVSVMERLTTSAHIRETFERDGQVKASFTVNGYLVDLTVKDKQKTAIPADVVVE